MPNAKRSKRTRGRSEPQAAEIPPCFIWMVREVWPLLRRFRPPRSRSRKHFRNAAIEVLEALRVLLEETIAWMRKEGPSEAELKRIHVSGE